MKNKLLIIDSHSLIYRSYYAFIKNPLRDGNGRNTSAIYGFITSIKKLINKFSIQYIVAAFDRPEETLRHKMFTEYKMEREKTPDDLIWQVEYIKKYCKFMGINVLEYPGYEADDIIATLVKKLKKDMEILIVTRDKDLFQLIDKDVKIFDPFSNTVITREHVINKLGVPPEKIKYYLALTGDRIDGIKGVRGIGPKTAVKIINKYKSWEDILLNEKKVISDITSAKLSLSLVELKEVPLSIDIKDISLNPKKNKDLNALFTELNFYSFIEEEKQIPTSSTQKIKELSSSLNLPTAIYPYDSQFVGINEKGIFKLTPEKINDTKIVFDLKSLLYKNNLKEPTFDIMIAFYLIYPNERSYSLHAMSPLLGIRPPSKDPVSSVKSIYNMYPKIKEKLHKLHLKDIYNNIEHPLIRILYSMEKRGVKIDTDVFLNFTNELKTGLEKIEEEIYRHAGFRFNISSSKQIGQLLFEHLKLPVIKKTKGGNYATSVDILKELVVYHPIIPLIMKHRKYNKLLTTYLNPLPKLLKEDKRLHTTFIQNGTVTGRLATRNPNLQNIPIKGELGPRMRKAFIAEEGNVLISLDYSQIELRILAHLSNDRNLIEAFSHNEDIHTSTAAKIFRVSSQKVTKEMRSKAKIVNYGIIYGMSEFGLAQRMSISRKEAHNFIKRYFETFPDIVKYQEELVKKAALTGYARTLKGRRRYLPGLKETNRNVFENARRACINFPIQGSAADIIKEAMIKVEETFPNALILQIHDELLLEVNEHNAYDTFEKTKQIMENVVSLKVPLTVEGNIGKNWEEAH